MCERCDREIREMDIRDTDLPGLPFTVWRWICAVPGCSHYCKVRNYGVEPFYYWPVKLYRSPKTGKWRGGWFNATDHYNICGRHWKAYMEQTPLRPIPRDFDYLFTKIQPIKKP